MPLTRLQPPTTRVFAPWMNRRARRALALSIRTHRELAKQTSRFPHRHRLHGCTRAIHHIIECHSHHSRARFDILPFTAPQVAQGVQSQQPAPPKKIFVVRHKNLQIFLPPNDVLTALTGHLRARAHASRRARDAAPTRRRARNDVLIFIASMRTFTGRASRRQRPSTARAFEIRTVARHTRVCDRG